METIWSKIGWLLISYVILRPIAEAIGLDNFFKNKRTAYSNLFYRSAAKGNTDRSSLFVLIFIASIIFITSEVIFLFIWNPPTTIIDKAFEQNPDQVGRWYMGFIFILNILLIEFIIRLSSIYAIIIRFNQMLTIIRPDIDYKKYYEYKKDWALMKSRDNYEKIITDLFSTYKTLMDEDKFPDEIKMYNKFLKKQTKK
jgi:hypothetical protein